VKMYNALAGMVPLLNITVKPAVSSSLRECFLALDSAIYEQFVEKALRSN